MTYARTRLWVGITGVGLTVSIASALLVGGVPARLLAERGGSFATDLATLWATLAIAAVLMLPFDVLGGFVLPRRFGRSSQAFGDFAFAWVRGTLSLTGVAALSGAVLTLSGRVGGRPLALVAFVAASLLLVQFQEPLARLVGGLRRVDVGGQAARRGAVTWLRGGDPGFFGGFTGRSATIVLPDSWRRRLEPSTLALLVRRRQWILESGAWRRTRWAAIGWNALGFFAASWLPGAGVDTAAGLVTTTLGFTLWTFVGLLLLPTPSRRAAVFADAAVARDDEQRELLGTAVATLDGLQDDEPERSPGLESVFHPVPSVAGRVRALASGAPHRRGVWHLARTALYLSYAGLSLLPRAVHCNVGRPELWVYMPTDG